MAGIYSEKNLYPTGSTLNVLFLDGGSKQTSAFKEAASEWEKYANLKFKYFTSSSRAPKENRIVVTFENAPNSCSTYAVFKSSIKNSCVDKITSKWTEHYSKLRADYNGEVSDERRKAKAEKNRKRAYQRELSNYNRSLKNFDVKKAVWTDYIANQVTFKEKVIVDLMARTGKSRSKIKKSDIERLLPKEPSRPKRLAPYASQYSPRTISKPFDLENFRGVVSERIDRECLTFPSLRISLFNRCPGQEVVTLNDKIRKKKIMHEIGHSLGLAHEHSNPYLPYEINKVSLDAWCAKAEYTNSRCYHNFGAWNNEEYTSTLFDEKSVMMYKLPKERYLKLKKSIDEPMELSKMDKLLIAKLYPGNSKFLVENRKETLALNLQRAKEEDRTCFRANFILPKGTENVELSGMLESDEEFRVEVYLNDNNLSRQDYILNEGLLTITKHKSFIIGNNLIEVKPVQKTKRVEIQVREDYKECIAWNEPKVIKNKKKKKKGKLLDTRVKYAKATCKEEADKFRMITKVTSQRYYPELEISNFSLEKTFISHNPVYEKTGEIYSLKADIDLNNKDEEFKGKVNPSGRISYDKKELLERILGRDEDIYFDLNTLASDISTVVGAFSKYFEISFVGDLDIDNLPKITFNQTVLRGSKFNIVDTELGQKLVYELPIEFTKEKTSITIKSGTKSTIQIEGFSLESEYEVLASSPF